jgi:DNA-binding transcriptional MerR regulator
MYKEPIIEQVQYTIGQVAKKFNINPSRIRYWSDEFEEIMKLERNNKENRIYRPKDVETISIIHNLVENQGMTLAGAKKRIMEDRDREYNIVEIITRLENIKSKLIEIKNSI